MSEPVTIDGRTGAVVRVPTENSWGIGALARMSPAEFETRIQDLKLGKERMKQIHQAVMEPGVDYGTVQGIDKPFLQQPGAENLCLFYHLAPSHVVDISTGDGITSPPLWVVIRCQLHVGSTDGPIVGEGVGAANSWETKHRRRFAELNCPACGQPHIRKSRQDDGGWFCWRKLGGCGATYADGDPKVESQERGQVDNPDPWDLLNTLLKMARKRALVDAAKGTTGTSWLYSQDPEDVEASAAAAPQEKAKARVQEQPRDTGRSQAPRNQPRTPSPESSGDRAANGGKCPECNAPNGKPHGAKCPTRQQTTAPPVDPPEGEQKANYQAPPTQPEPNQALQSAYADMSQAYASAGGDHTDTGMLLLHARAVLSTQHGKPVALETLDDLMLDEILSITNHFHEEGLPHVDPFIDES